MKKLIAMTALCMAGMVFAQEPEAAPEAAAAQPAKCECVAGKPCVCPKPCQCGGEEKKGPRGEFRKRDGRHGKPGMRGPEGRGMNRQGPKFKKCECSPECQGIVILPPNASEGEPLFKLFGGERRGQRPEFKGRRPEFKRAKPEQPGCPCGQGPACNCPKGE